MKTLARLKLNQLSKAEIEKREMNALHGGSCCGCGCHYYGDGGSSIAGNYSANYDYGYSSYGGSIACGEMPVRPNTHC